jgi:hypothetical protein|tara:strand:- start:43 stop:2316 length:2274 start_codon:yes stop_codon:yes gene_type:complete
MSCKENPHFVIVKKTGTGFSFDNDVTYKSPFASHTLSQAKGVLHPSLQVKSDWGINPKDTIVQLLTGQAAADVLKSPTGRDIILTKTKTDKKSGKKTTISKFGLLAPSKTSSGYTLTRFGDRSEGLSVAELSNLLSDISMRPTNIKVRGSPLEYKRLLDYIQFLMVEKVTNDKSLYLARPNNHHVMDAVHTDGVSLEDAYAGMHDEDSTLYNTAYFVTMDRVAALASVVREIPTIYQTGNQYYYNVPTTNVIPRIREILTSMLKSRGYTMPKISMNSHNNRTQELVTPKGRPVITSGSLFVWFLDTRNVSEKTNAKGTRIVGSNFHNLDMMDKALILFYWVFNYPSYTSGVNKQVVKYFLAILDTFHDFTDSKRIASFKNMWPESKNTKPYTNARIKTRNGITNQNIPTTSQQHKFLVKLLGVDIYRKVGKYNKSIENTISKTNTRGAIPAQLRVAHFLYFITNVLGSQPSRGLIGACEELSRDIMIKLSGDTFINKPWNFRDTNREPGENICKLLNKEKACLVIDAINGSVPACMKKYSVFHNVGIIDPADKGVLSWGEVVGEDGCRESKKVQAQRKKAKQKRDAIKKASKNKTERLEKAKATRIQTKKNEAAANKRKANLKAIQIKQASNRRNALAKKRGTAINKPVNKPINKPTVNFNALGNMKMNISKGAPPPNMQSFKLYLNAPNVNNETVKNLLNRITYNKSKYIGTNKQTIRNVLNKVIRLNKNDNLNRKARNLKSTMFANNNRQTRSGA